VKAEVWHLVDELERAAHGRRSVDVWLETGAEAAD
jgi:hypothetical protein